MGIINWKLTPGTKQPQRGTDWSAGFDLPTAETIRLEPGVRQLVSTGVSVALPYDAVGQVWPRSGLAVRHGLHVGAGIIDADYRGEIKVLLFNLGGVTFEADPGERIAQLVVLPRYLEWTARVVDDLPDSERSDGGFGSTGL